MRIVRILLARHSAAADTTGAQSWSTFAEHVKAHHDVILHVSIVEVTDEYVELAAFVPGVDVSQASIRAAVTAALNRCLPAGHGWVMSAGRDGVVT